MTLTVHRGISADDHVYDEIFYSENLSQNLSQQSLSQNLSQQDENTPFNMASSSSSRPRVRMEDTGHHPPPPSSSATPRGKHAHRVLHHQHKSPQGMEKGSKDSGLSSGSSTHQDQEDRQGLQYRSRTQSQGSQSSQGSQLEQRSNGRCRIEGNYEVEVSGWDSLGPLESKSRASGSGVDVRGSD